MKETIAFIGAGNMAEALIRGLLAAKTATPKQIIAADVRAERLVGLQKEFFVRTELDNAEAVQEADIVVLSVKPQKISAALKDLKPEVSNSKLLISIAAGITTARIEQELGGKPRVVRTMPNTPALVGAGAAALCPGRYATEKDLAMAERILGAAGITVRVEEEDLDAVTALSGSGPAYVFYLAEAMIAAGQELGLSEEVARRLAVQTIFGAGKLLEESSELPEELRRKVTSPGGTTEAALRVKMERGFAKIVAEAMRAAARRSRELSGN